ncbi:MAG: adenosine deaminase [Sphaerochaetaceae bacterium]|nr:adenosine deaminase [Sphaerochaetaceae bacterium]MDD4258529.1 adenosine deaminase [Sphaerochaetaceae bacterium]
MLTKEIIHRIPKVELHDHLDGGLRPTTIIELAELGRVQLPTSNPKELADWFGRGCRQKSLPLYLETFQVTVAVLQSQEALKRVAVEAIEDLSAQNIVYAEIRFAPILHTINGLSMEAVVSAVLEGLEEGRHKTGMEYGLILCALRNQSPELSLEVAKLAVAFRARKVVGFDLAGDESGNPPKKHLGAFQYIRNQNFNITIHAGEGFGLESIWQAIQVCGGHRIGHGTRLIEDMLINGLKIEKMGSLAHFIQDRRIPMEMCLTSNVGTGAAADYASHPFIVFFRNNFRVFLCADNRLMSETNMTREMEIATEQYGLTIRDLEKITVNAMKSAFLHHTEKIRIIFDVIKRGYADIRKEFGLTD